MKFGHYVNESVTKWKLSPAEFNKTIKKECKPYLRALGGATPLYRAIRERGVGMGKKKTRADRRSLYGTDPKILNNLNAWLKKERHISRTENVVIGTGSYKNAENFSDYANGEVYYIFPKGSIKYTYIEANDMNIVDEKTGWLGGLGLRTYLFDYDPKNHRQWVTKGGPSIMDIEKVNLTKDFRKFFHSNNLDKAIYNGYEVWIQCKEYYLASVENFLWINNTLALRT